MQLKIEQKTDCLWNRNEICIRLSKDIYKIAIYDLFLLAFFHILHFFDIYLVNKFVKRRTCYGVDQLAAKRYRRGNLQALDQVVSTLFFCQFFKK